MKTNANDNFLLFYSNIDNILFVMPKNKLNTFGDAHSMIKSMQIMADMLNEIGKVTKIYANEIEKSNWTEANWVFWKIIPYPENSVHLSEIKDINYRMWHFIEEITQ